LVRRQKCSESVNITLSSSDSLLLGTEAVKPNVLQFIRCRVDIVNFIIYKFIFIFCGKRDFVENSAFLAENSAFLVK
jgi:hypothetical protein